MGMMVKLVNRFADNVLSRPTEDFLGCLVHEGRVSVQVQPINAFAGGIEYQLMLSLKGAASGGASVKVTRVTMVGVPTSPINDSFDCNTVD